MATVMDPTSAVKEGEQRLAVAQQSLSEEWKGRLRRAWDGEQALGLKGRAELMDTLANRVNSYGEEARTDVTDFTERAKRGKADPADVVPTLPGDAESPIKNMPLPPERPPEFGGQNAMAPSIPRVNSPEEAMKLQPGTQFYLPDGRLGTVPGSPLPPMLPGEA